MERQGIRRVAFFGVSDEMEVAFATLQGCKIKLAGIVDEEESRKGREVFGHTVGLRDLKRLGADAILVTSIREAKTSVDKILREPGLDFMKVFTL